MDDVDLKNLLDEAYTYKSPKDRAQKSAMFNVSVHRNPLLHSIKKYNNICFLLCGHHRSYCNTPNSRTNFGLIPTAIPCSPADIRQAVRCRIWSRRSEMSTVTAVVSITIRARKNTHRWRHANARAVRYRSMSTRTRMQTRRRLWPNTKEANTNWLRPRRPAAVAARRRLPRILHRISLFWQHQLIRMFAQSRLKDARLELLPI